MRKTQLSLLQLGQKTTFHRVRAICYSHFMSESEMYMKLLGVMLVMGKSFLSSNSYTYILYASSYTYFHAIICCPFPLNLVIIYLMVQRPVYTVAINWILFWRENTCTTGAWVETSSYWILSTLACVMVIKEYCYIYHWSFHCFMWLTILTFLDISFGLTFIILSICRQAYCKAGLTHCYS